MTIANISAELLGAATGNLVGNPFTLVAGFIISRLALRSARFWLELVIGIGLCVGVQVLVDDLLSHFPRVHSGAWWVAVTALSVVMAVLVFKVLRRVKEAMPLHQKMDSE